MPVDFTGQTYRSTDGKFEFAYDELHATTILNALARTFDHVFGNEAIAKASTAKKKAEGGELSEAEVAEIVAKAREKYLADMKAGTWGEKGSRGPRMPAKNRLEQIVNNLLAEDTRRAVVKQGFKPGEATNTWVHPDGRVFNLAVLMGVYQNNPQLGAERMADIQARAERKLADEQADAEARKAAKEREAQVGKIAQGEEIVL